MHQIFRGPPGESMCLFRRDSKQMTKFNNYEQPYSPRHVIDNTVDPLRADNALYIRRFPRFLYNLYRKQTPFNPRMIKRKLKLRTTPREKSPSVKASVSKSPEMTVSDSQPPPFKTYATSSSAKSPAPGDMAAVPSDFEHIFHYSEVP